MAHITQEQKQQIADLRAAGLSFVRISQQTGINQSTCKNVFYDYRNNPAKGVPSVKAPDGKFRAQKPRTGPGRRPKNGLAAQSDAERMKAYRARKKAEKGIS